MKKSFAPLGTLIFTIILLFFIQSCKEEVTTPENRAPKIQNLSATPQSVIINGQVVLTCVATDEDGDNLTITWTSTNGSFPNGSTGTSVNWNAPSSSGNAIISATVSDGKSTALDTLHILITANIIPTNGLVAYYPLNGNANDESGNGNNGTLQGDYQVVNGIKNDALRFIAHGSTDSLGGHVLLPNFHFMSMSSFSYTLWIKEESLMDAENYISFRDDRFGIPYAGISHSPANNIIEFQVGVTSTNPALTAPFSSSYTNNFVQYCLVYTNGMIKGYINGSFIGQKAQTAIVDGIYSAVARHWFNIQTSTRFTGVVDEVRVYNRALTDNEIQTLYHEGD